MTGEKKTTKLPQGNRAKAKAGTKQKAEPVLRDEAPTAEELSKAMGIVTAHAAGSDDEADFDEGLDEPTPDDPSAIVDQHEDDDDDGDFVLPDLDGDGGGVQPVEPVASPPSSPAQKHPAPAPAMHSGRMTVTRMYSTDGEDHSEEELLEIGVFLTQPAQVSVTYRATTNLGNYESAQVGVSVSVPCYVEEIDAALVFATRKAEERLAAEVSAIRGSSTGTAMASAVTSRDADPPAADEMDGDDDEDMTFALPDLD